MQTPTRWDALAIGAALFCAGPEIVTDVRLGLPSDLALWEWLTIVPIAALLLATPQLAMFAFVTATRSRPLRVICFLASVARLGLYYHYVRTGDFTSTSTAVVGLFFLQLYMAAASSAVAGVLLWLHKRLFRNQSWN